ncbi:MAG: type I polyketide synthase [Ruminococcaceae bacterium]|nr:type I polyketide synthase [Oscillospiraceae bacterium]
MLSPNALSQLVIQELKDGKIQKESAVHLLKKINEPDDIAVIGMGCYMSDKENPEQVWDVIAQRHTTIDRCPKERLDLIKGTLYAPPTIYADERNYCKGSFFRHLDSFDNRFFEIDDDQAEYLPPNARVAFKAVYRALEDGGYLGERLRKNRTPIFLGNDFSKDAIFSYSSLCMKRSNFYMTPVENQLNYPAALATRVSNYFNLHGPTYSLDCSCPGGGVALYNACNAIRNNECATALAVGVFTDLAPLKLYNQGTDFITNDDEMIPRLYDREPAGVYNGEGGSALLLKRLSRAIADGDRIHAVIGGASFWDNGREGTFARGSALIHKESAEKAIREAQINAEDIELYLSEGVVSEIETAIELSGVSGALRQFTNKQQFCAVSNFTNLGYLHSCIGQTGLIVATMAMKKKQLPPLYHFVTPQDSYVFSRSPFYINDMLRPWKEPKSGSRCSLVMTYGFGGTSLFFVAKEAPKTEVVEPKQRQEELFVLSAKSPWSMREYIKRYIDFLEENPQVNLRTLCGNLGSRRLLFKEQRLAVVAYSVEDLKEKLKHFLATEHTSVDVCFGERPINWKRVGEKTNYMPVDGKSLTELAKAFASGKDFELSKLYADGVVPCMDLPVYPFEERKAWCYKDRKHRKEQLARISHEAGI